MAKDDIGEKDIVVPELLKATIDADIDQLAADLVVVQENYKELNGSYWQGAPTATVDAIPADGTVIVPDIEAKPTDVDAKSWSEVGIVLKPSMEAAFSVSTYDGPMGKGYNVHAEVMVDKVLFRRCVAFGPDSSLESPWMPHRQIDMTA